MQNILTDKERGVLTDAMLILEAHTQPGVTWMPGARISKDSGHFSFDLTYFTSRGEQHGWVRGKSFGDKVEEALQIQAREDDDDSGVRARRIERLKEELSALTGEPCDVA